MKRKHSEKEEKKDSEKREFDVLADVITVSCDELPVSVHVTMTYETNSTEFLVLKQCGDLEYVHVPNDSVVSKDEIAVHDTDNRKLIRVYDRDTRQLTNSLTTDYPIVKLAGGHGQFVIVTEFSDNRYIVYQWIHQEHRSPCFAFCIHSDSGITYSHNREDESCHPFIRLHATWKSKPAYYTFDASTVKECDGPGTKFKTTVSKVQQDPPLTDASVQSPEWPNHYLTLKKHELLQYQDSGRIQIRHVSTHHNTCYTDPLQREIVRALESDFWIVYGYQMAITLSLYRIPTMTSSLYIDLATTFLPCVTDMILSFLYPESIDRFVTDLRCHDNVFWMWYNGTYTRLDIFSDHGEQQYNLEKNVHVIGWDANNRAIIAH